MGKSQSVSQSQKRVTKKDFWRVTAQSALNVDKVPNQANEEGLSGRDFFSYVDGVERKRAKKEKKQTTRPITKKQKEVEEELLLESSLRAFNNLKDKTL